MKLFAVSLITVISLSFAQNQLPKDSEGWTLFTPANDSRIAYVSESLGDDDAAQTYSPDDPAIGNDPFTPSGSLLPFRTIAAAFDAVRDGYPDWVLLRRGDTWLSSGQMKNGRSATEPFLFGAYGEDSERPLLKTGAQQGLNVCCKNTNYWAVVGISFYAHTRDKDSPDFTSHSGGTGFNIYSGEEYTATGILIEDCRFSWYTNNVIQGPGTLEDIVVRRNVITDNYDTSAHSQGLYTNNVSMLLEENIFDHNGWYTRSINSDNDQNDGQATIFNHNTYFSHAHNVTFRGNIFLRASSIGNKWTANSGEASAHDITIENNLYVEGEIGISMGGNNAGPLRFKNIRIADNVMLDIGHGQPTNRTLGWGIDIQEWDSGTVANNYLLHNPSSEVRNVYAINLNGAAGTRNVAITGNTVYGVNTNSALVIVKDTVNNCSFSNNTIWGSGTNGRLLNAGSYRLGGVNFSENTYTGERAPDEWFSTPDGSGDLNDWSTYSSASGSDTVPPSLPDPDRSIETYQEYLGRTGSFDAFITEVRMQSKQRWRSAYTADAVNTWIRAGFGASEVAQQPGYPHLSTGKVFHRDDLVQLFSIDGRLLGTFSSAENARRTLKGSVGILRWRSESNSLLIPLHR